MTSLNAQNFVSTDAFVPNGARPVLSAQGISVSFGGLKALSDVAIEVPQNALIGLIGPNGAGKTTLFGVLSGLQRANSGRVSLLGEDVTHASARARARKGLPRTFQHPELFPGLTVEQHLILAYRARFARSRLWKDLFTAGSLRRQSGSERDRINWLIDLLRIRPFADNVGENLPMGTRRLVEVGRALAFGPSVILLDEPFAGLDSHESAQLAIALRRVVDDERVSILLVDHDAGIVLDLSRYVYVLDFGLLIFEGSPESVRTSEIVRAAYLGDHFTTD